MKKDKISLDTLKKFPAEIVGSFGTVAIIEKGQAVSKQIFIQSQERAFYIETYTRSRFFRGTVVDVRRVYVKPSHVFKESFDQLTMEKFRNRKTSSDKLFIALNVRRKIRSGK